MRIKNLTDIPVENIFWRIVEVSKLDTKGLKVRVIYMRSPSQSTYSSSFEPNTNQINVRINKDIQYPYPLQIATGEWFENTDGSFFQIYKKVLVDRPEQICAFAFARELSHFKDLVEGKNLKYRQTKADQFSENVCRGLRIIQDQL